MNTQVKNLIEITEQVLKEQQEKAWGQTPAKLRAVHDACADIVRHNGVPTTAGVCEWIFTNRPGSIVAASTIDNTRAAKDGTKTPSSHKIIIKAWMNVVVSKSTPGTSGGGSIEDDTSYITQAELGTIKDKSLRHKVSILLGQASGYDRQEKIIEAVKQLPPIPGVAKLENSAPQKQLDCK